MRDPGRVRQLAEKLSEGGYRNGRASISGEALKVVTHALRVYADHLENMRPADPLNDAYFVLIEDERGHVEEMLAKASNVIVARGAFEEACKLRPKGTLVLKHGTRLICERKPAADENSSQPA